MKIQKIVNNRSNPFQILVENYGFSNTQFQVCLEKRGKNNRISFSDINFESLYIEQRKIKYKKYIDLQKLMEFIPDEFQWIYTTLEHEDDEPKLNEVKRQMV